MADTTRTSRRSLIKTGMLATAGAAASTVGFSTPAIAKNIVQWKMVMTWQKVLPGLGTGAVRLAERITKLSEGSIEVKVYGGGELVPPLGVFEAVAQGTAELAHTAPYYWISKNPAAPFFCVVPGGMTADEQNAWLYYGGGLKLWHDLYAEFGLTAYPAGNTGAQMGGWFTREINSLSDLQGLKMRIPGMAGEVVSRLGVNQQNIPPQDLYTSIQSGVIDALEWVGPWNDIALGFHKVAPYYYGPGFHEPGPTLECMINLKAFESLRPWQQRVIKTACAVENQLMRSEYMANNMKAYLDMRDKHKVDIRSFPDDVMTAFFDMSAQVVRSVADKGGIEARIFESYDHFRRKAVDYGQITDVGYANARYAHMNRG